MKRRISQIVIAAAFAASLAMPVLAQDEAKPFSAETVPRSSDRPAHSGHTWQFSVTPYMWAVSVDSKVTIGDYSTSSSMTFSDIWNDLQVAGEIHLEARKGKFGFFLDPTYLQLRQNSTFTGTRNGAAPPPVRDLTLTADMWLVEFGALYQVGKWALGDKVRSLSVDVLGGGRYWYLHGSLDTGSLVNPTSTSHFVDPIIGATLKADLTENLMVYLRGDIGGFGVGSDFSWNGAALFGYRITPAVTALFGYRMLYLDYKAGSSRARYDITMQGPIGGIAFMF